LAKSSPRSVASVYANSENSYSRESMKAGMFLPWDHSGLSVLRALSIL